MEIGAHKARILGLLFEQVPLSDPVDTLDFALSGDFAGKFRVAGSALPDGDYLAFNLPTYSRTVFFAFNNSGLEPVGRVLANLEDYEREASTELRLGEVVILPDQDVGTTGPFAVLLLPTETAPVLSEVPHVQQINGESIHFCLAVPLSREEYDLRRREGPDALLGLFERAQKSLSFD